LWWLSKVGRNVVAAGADGADGADSTDDGGSVLDSRAYAGIDIGKNSFHVLGHDKRGAIMLRKWSRGQVEARLGLIGMEV
jgi:hypothetical protein